MWKFALVLLLCLCIPFKDLYLLLSLKQPPWRCSRKRMQKYCEYSIPPNISKSFLRKICILWVIFDIYQSDGKQKRNQEGLFDQIGEKKEEEGH